MTETETSIKRSGTPVSRNKQKRLRVVDKIRSDDNIKINSFYFIFMLRLVVDETNTHFDCCTITKIGR